MDPATLTPIPNSPPAEMHLMLLATHKDKCVFLRDLLTVKLS